MITIDGIGSFPETPVGLVALVKALVSRIDDAAESLTKQDLCYLRDKAMGMKRAAVDLTERLEYLIEDKEAA